MIGSEKSCVAVLLQKRYAHTGGSISIHISYNVYYTRLPTESPEINNDVSYVAYLRSLVSRSRIPGKARNKLIHTKQKQEQNSGLDYRFSLT